MEAQDPLGSLPGASSARSCPRASPEGLALKQLCSGVRCARPHALPSRWDTRTTVMGWSAEGTRQLVRCPQPPTPRGHAAPAEGEALSSRWAVLVTPNGGLSEEHSSLETKQTP